MSPDAALRAQLIEAARTVATERGWVWREPVEVVSGAEGGEAVWIVSTNVMTRGTNVRILLRRSDGSLVRAANLPR